MIPVSRLKYYPAPDTIDSSLTSVIEENIIGDRNGLRIRQTLLLFATFLDITHQRIAFIDLNNSSRLKKIFREFAGFLYSETDASMKSNYGCILTLKEAFSMVFNDRRISSPTFPSPSVYLINDEIGQCISEYQKQHSDPERLLYFSGWSLESKCGYLGSLNLGFFYKQYGKSLSDCWHQAATEYFSRQTKTTFNTQLVNFHKIISSVCQLCPNFDSLYNATNTKKINRFIEMIFSTQKLYVIANQLQLASFYNSWAHQIGLIEKILIKGGIWPEPLYEIFRPRFKTSSKGVPSHRFIDENGSAFNKKLITYVPLCYSDDESIEEILQKILSDIDHVEAACRDLVEQIQRNLTLRKRLARSGQVKPILTKKKQIS